MQRGLSGAGLAGQGFRTAGILVAVSGEGLRGRAMPTIFTRIINGELPGRFVWRDPQAVAFLTINPITRGHTLVVPRAEVDHWVDLAPDLAQHLMRVAQAVGRAQQRAFNPVRVGLMIAGLEVPHVHLHVLPIAALGDLDFRKADPSPRPADLDRAAAGIREALRGLGYAEAAD
jgi:histidine triad (HIT) family protein